MGLAMTKLYRLFWSNKERKILIIGLDNSGKTTTLYQISTGETVQTAPTIGSNVVEHSWKNINFIMWDVGGQESLRATWSTYYQDTEFLIVVIDSTDKVRLPIIKNQLYSMLTHEDLAHVAILVYANKQDIKGALTAAEISNELKLVDIKTHKWQIQASSALTGEGIVAGLEWIAGNLS
uniref:ADP-ribosylation factor-like protein 5B n=1 Tax=Rhabditophanes sp. KR3021 TaxID=114890 RepID=A0AC35TRX1_9BILA